MKESIKCDWCGKTICRYPSQMKKHNFCSRECLAAFSNREKNPEKYAELKDFTNISKHMSELNREMNPGRMTPEIRRKMRECHLDSGEGKTYTKYYSRLAHRVVAEQILGRPLKPGEVVHHLDFNRRNNDPQNLMIFRSNADHSRYHAKLRRFFEKGVIDDTEIKEVMPL